MKQATCEVKMSKDQSVIKTNVTPVEALLLTAEHHRNVGGSPIDVHKDTIKDVPSREVEEEYIVTPAVEAKPANGNVPAVEAKAAVKGTRKKTISRSIDDECNRLRGIYGSAKVDSILTKVRDIPVDDFDKAVQLGTTIIFPSSKLSETKIL